MYGLCRFAALVTFFSLICQTSCSGHISSGAAARMNTFELLKAAASAVGAKQTEDAAFLFYAAQMRFKIDKQVYPPVEKGADSPDVLKTALGFTLGPSIVPALANDPVALTNVANRLAQWTPSIDAGYDPGWKYQNALGANASQPIIAATRKTVLEPLQKKVKLQANAEYARLTKVMSEANAVDKRFWDNRHAAKGQPPPKELIAEHEAMIHKRSTATKRMQELEWELVPDSRWHAQVGWKAEDYFQDPQLIALCRAVEANDVNEMERLIAAGADANAVGKDGMTPLLWAFPDRKLERFECLLKRGANPNLFITANFGTRSQPFHPYLSGGGFVDDRGCQAGQSIMHLASRSPMIEYLQLVVAHGGDANLINQVTRETPLDIVLNRNYSDMKDRVELLAAHKANLKRYAQPWPAYPITRAVQSYHYDAALSMLEAGADPCLYQPGGIRKLVHFVFREKQHQQSFTKAKADEYQALVNWLERHGELLATAQKDEERWDKLYKGVSLENHKAITNQIIAERNDKNK